MKCIRESEGTTAMTSLQRTFLHRLNRAGIILARAQATDRATVYSIYFTAIIRGDI